MGRLFETSVLIYLLVSSTFERGILEILNLGVALNFQDEPISLSIYIYIYIYIYIVFKYYKLSTKVSQPDPHDKSALL